MNKYLCFLLFSLIFNLGFSQTEEDFIQTIKVQYAKNNKSKACEESKKGLTKFPNSARIAKLQALVCTSINNGSTTGGSTTGGSTTGGSTTGGSTAGGSTTGGSTAGGSTAGGTSTGGTEVREPKIINLNTGFKRVADQNKVEWSKFLAENAVKITVVFSVNGLTFSYDCTGSTSCTYDPGTSRAAGRSTTVKLIVDYGDKKVNESGPLELTNQLFICSPQNN